MGALHEDLHACQCPFLKFSEYSFEWKVLFQMKAVEKNKTCILCAVSYCA
jgi:hypothetical protein